MAARSKKTDSVRFCLGRLVGSIYDEYSAGMPRGLKARSFPDLHAVPKRRSSTVVPGAVGRALLSPLRGWLLLSFFYPRLTPLRLRSGQALGSILSPLRGWTR